MKSSVIMAQDNPAFELQEETNVTGNETQTIVDEIQASITEVTDEDGIRGDILYTVEEAPRWYLCILLGIQQYLTMFGLTVAYPYIVAPKLCIQESDPARGYISSTIFFVSGLGTLIQSTFGTRLPIIQSSSSVFLAPIFAILSLPQWKCPSEEEMLSATEEELQEIWQLRMREIQGAMIVASIFEMVIGLTGVIGVMLKWLTPLVFVPTVSLIGLSLFEESASTASKNWGIAIMTIFLLLLFSQYLQNINIPGCSYSKETGWKIKQFPFFQAFSSFAYHNYSVGILCHTNCCRCSRTNQRRQWGLPTFSIGAVFGIFSGILASIVKSVGDYYACARLACAPHPPTNAINRGIFAEGISCILSGIWGSGCELTSCSENIGAIGITKVASRRVIECAAVTMMLFAVLGKFGAFFSIIPEPIIGGIVCVMFAIVTGVGLSNVQFIDLQSSRNILILGLSLFMGITIPKWFKGHPNTIDVGNDAANQLITVLLNTSTFIGGLIAFVLDNSIPGTDEERGLIKWREQGFEHNESEGDYLTLSSPSTYDLPFGMNLIKRYKIFKFIPISPTYDQNIFLRKVRPLFERFKPKYNNNIDSEK
ncbi:solute carrier family 23 member 2-like [Tachypleus tridentatus]|uniref:solute carrier family 23 member 2-like n=1 Tax=Tachypleus tridentatus TaxID=6853 RepID=UPI003FCFA1C5